MKIKKFKEYSKDLRLNENLTEFGFNHISATGVAGSGVASDSTQPNDPQLSTNGFDRWKNNMVNAQNRLMDILKSVFNVDSDFKISKDIDYKLEKLKINKIFKNNNESVDIYIEYSFKHDPEKIYDGVFRDWGGNYKPKFISNILESNNKLFNNKITGLIKNTLEKWFKPSKGEYFLLKNELNVWNNIGLKETLYLGDKVRVTKVLFNNNNLSKEHTVVILKDNKEYKIKNSDFWYFNWWFEKIKKPNLKI